MKDDSLQCPLRLSVRNNSSKIVAFNQNQNDLFTHFHRLMELSRRPNSGTLLHCYVPHCVTQPILLRLFGNLANGFILKNFHGAQSRMNFKFHIT